MPLLSAENREAFGAKSDSKETSVLQFQGLNLANSLHELGSRFIHIEPLDRTATQLTP